ncbi:hypothetical protein CTEN210_06601 [Chaetoceros tenuissimus]|uniref:Calcineurin-like phosphoesterase domain-containing protein n=1 Tax=Chaetoceros tenuissimus TaxID=426638 RepID=A0AAD3CS88_9STRA|nr:hypothetical protein CTEN210_06601 [Chaetoceros tenuissimus]
MFFLKSAFSMKSSLKVFLILSILSTSGSQSSMVPLQDVNILAVTDVHSWVAGQQPHNQNDNMDYGDVLSFYERLNATAAEQEKDLFFVMNGDWMDGTGISTNPPKHLTPILEKMPFDAITVGNHELYKNSTIEFITKDDGFINFWKGRYLSSNVYLTDTNEPLGSKYLFLQGRYSKRTILFFGFLYNMQDHCKSTEVKEVQTVVNEPWFENVLGGGDGSYDAIVCLSHMDANDELLSIILHKIRTIAGSSMPVQFITGHSHQRKFNQIDPFSCSFEPGKYLDTLGFTLIGMNRADLLKTRSGQDLTNLIGKTESELGLNERVGCAPQTYNLTAGLHEPDSLWGFYLKQVIPQELFQYNDSKLFIQTAGGFRSNLYEGNVTVDDFIKVSPFDDDFYLATEGLLGRDFLAAFKEINSFSTKTLNWGDPVVSGKVEEDRMYDIYTVDFDLGFLGKALNQSTGRIFNPKKLSGVTSNIILRRYINVSWDCDKEDKDRLLVVKYRKSFAVGMAMILTTFILWNFYKREKILHEKVPNHCDREERQHDGNGMIYNSDNDHEIDSKATFTQLCEQRSGSYELA